MPDAGFCQGLAEDVLLRRQQTVGHGTDWSSGLLLRALVQSQLDGRSRPGDKDVDLMVSRVQELVNEGLVAKDLTLCWLFRRVRPLQSRAHKMGFMSGRFDPTRLTPMNFTTAALDSFLRASLAEPVKGSELRNKRCL